MCGSDEPQTNSEYHVWIWWTPPVSR